MEKNIDKLEAILAEPHLIITVHSIGDYVRFNRALPTNDKDKFMRSAKVLLAKTHVMAERLKDTHIRIARDLIISKSIILNLSPEGLVTKNPYGLSSGATYTYKVGRAYKKALKEYLKTQ